jgi:proteasome lid subunit RPN8/RPN11
MSRSNRKSRQKRQDAKETAPEPSPAAPPEPGETPAEKTGAPTGSTVEIKTRDVSNTPDFNSDQWPQRVWPVDAGPRGDGFAVIIKRSVLNAVHRHGHVNTEVEICGVLVGNVFRDAKGPFLLVDSIIRGDFAGSGNAQVTFTAETWNHIQGVMEAEHPEGRIVGWYHTHPNFGIFLSDMDLFIHGNFFNMPWQIALVYDPVNSDEGVFLWKDGKAQRGSFITLEDAEREVPTVSVSPEITAAALADFSRRTQRMEHRFKMLVALVLLLLVVIAVYPMVLWWVMGNPRGEQAIMVIPQQPTSAPVITPATQEVKPAVIPASQPLAVLPATQVVVTQPATAPSLHEVLSLLKKPEATTQPLVAPTTSASATKPIPPALAPEVIRPKTQTTGAKVLDAPSEASH